MGHPDFNTQNILFVDRSKIHDVWALNIECKYSPNIAQPYSCWIHAVNFQSGPTLRCVQYVSEVHINVIC